MPNEIIVAAAGGGKTTRIVARAIADPTRRAALITYTTNNVSELYQRLYQAGPVVPTHVEVWSWFRFLLQEIIRPYRQALLERRIDGVQFVDARSARFVKKTNVAKYYLADGGRLVYSDKISELAMEINKASQGAVLARLAERFKTLFIDEIQDMAGYDLDLVEAFLNSGIDIVLVGDHRQATFRTNNSARNKAFSEKNIIGKFRAWDKAKLAALSYERETHRCHQRIADLADKIFPDEPSTISLNKTDTGHDGIFVLKPANVTHYVQRFSPSVLRLDRRTDCGGFDATNFGESKGMTFDRVLIFPHRKGQDWLRTGDFGHIEGSASKLYVGITRARHSVTFVFDGECALDGVPHFDPVGD